MKRRETAKGSQLQQVSIASLRHFTKLATIYFSACNRSGSWIVTKRHNYRLGHLRVRSPKFSHLLAPWPWVNQFAFLYASISLSVKGRWYHLMGRGVLLWGFIIVCNTERHSDERCSSKDCKCKQSVLSMTLSPESLPHANTASVWLSLWVLLVIASFVCKKHSSSQNHSHTHWLKHCTKNAIGVHVSATSVTMMSFSKLHKYLKSVNIHKRLVQPMAPPGFHGRAKHWLLFVQCYISAELLLSQQAMVWKLELMSSLH